MTRVLRWTCVGAVVVVLAGRDVIVLVARGVMIRDARRRYPEMFDGHAAAKVVNDLAERWGDD